MSQTKKQARQVAALERLKARKHRTGRYAECPPLEGEELNRVNVEMKRLRKALGERRHQP